MINFVHAFMKNKMALVLALVGLSLVGNSLIAGQATENEAKLLGYLSGNCKVIKACGDDAELAEKKSYKLFCTNGINIDQDKSFDKIYTHKLGFKIHLSDKSTRDISLLSWYNQKEGSDKILPAKTHYLLLEKNEQRLLIKFDLTTDAINYPDISEYVDSDSLGKMIHETQESFRALNQPQNIGYDSIKKPLCIVIAFLSVGLLASHLLNNFDETSKIFSDFMSKWFPAYFGQK